MSSRGQATQIQRASAVRPHTPPLHRRAENPVRIGHDFRVGESVQIVEIASSVA